MRRSGLSIVLMAALSAAACAGFQKGPGPLRQQVEALQVAQNGLELRMVAAEARLSELAAKQEAAARRVAAVEAAAPKAPAQPASPAPEAKAAAGRAKAVAAAAAAAPAQPAYKGPEGLYEGALATLREKDKPKEAKALFERFLKLYPKHDLVPNALYWSGECLYSQHEWAAAVVAFRQVVATYPKHPKAAAALLKMGYSYLCLDDEFNARDYLGRVVRLYPDSEEAQAARTSLKRLDEHEGKNPDKGADKGNSDRPQSAAKEGKS